MYVFRNLKMEREIINLGILFVNKKFRIDPICLVIKNMP